MKRIRSVPLALFATLALAWSVPASAFGDCNNGKAIYNKKVAGVDISCSQSSCHKANLTGNNITNGANNPGLIDMSLDNVPEMNNLRGTLNLTFSDIDDIATFIFYYPNACPSGGGTVNLQAAPAPVSLPSTTIGGTSATTLVTITNSGTAAAAAVTATSNDATHFPLSSNTCTGVSLAAAGGTCSFRVAFHPTAVGALSSNVTVNRTGGTLTVGVSGTGTTGALPGQLAVPGAINFGSQTIGVTSSASSVTISNTGGTAVAVSSVTSNNATEFAVVSNTCSTVNAGGSCVVGVTFKPSSSGARAAVITVLSNGTGSPQAIAASGTGTSVTSPGALSMNSSITFGSQAVGLTSAPTSVNVTNVGGAAVAISSVSSSNPAEFAITSSNCGMLIAGASCQFSATFNPGAVGARSGSFTVVSNGTGSPQAIGVSGTGTSGQSGSPTVTVVEYHHASFDHYFITPVAGEIVLLDARAPPFQDWTRTGITFKAYVNATAPAGSVAICRFFNDHFAPKSSHFYAAHGGGCEVTISQFPDWGLEDDKLFNTMLPSAGGTCPAGTNPIYRMYNQGQGAAPNHRFVTNLTDQQTMINQGFAAEGVVMCVPQ